MLLLGVALALSGCRADPEAEMTREQFTDVMVALRMAAHETEGVPAFEARKDSVLNAAGVTDSMLVDFARRHGGDVAFMASVWDTVARRLLDADTMAR